MRGAMEHAMAGDNVQNYKGGVDIHTRHAIIERAHQQIQQMQASMFHESIGATGGKDESSAKGKDEDGKIVYELTYDDTTFH